MSFTDKDSEKDLPVHNENAIHEDLHLQEVTLHQEVVSQDVTAEKIAAEVLAVDDVKKQGLRNKLATNHQVGYFPLTPEERKAHRSLNMKFDIYVIPFCAMIYLFNGLDRSNLGNAQTDNFSVNLGISSNSVNTATSLFFATYVPFQPIMAGIGKRFGQTNFVAIICSIWGLLTICHAFVKNDAQLIAVRLLMGIAEAGFYPTIISYLSLFYPRYDLAFRIAVFYGMFSIAGAFGGLIAFGVFQINGSLYGWQYLFIIEGAVPILLAIIAPFWLAKNAQTAWFLNESERAYAVKRMVIDSPSNLDATYKMSRRDIVETIKDWKLWLMLWPALLAGMAPQGFTIFFPVVVKGLGYSGAYANLMTVPPYVLGTIVTICFAYASDHFQNRTVPMMIGLTVVIIGLTVTLTLPLTNVHGRYGGLLVLLGGTFIVSPLTSAWMSGNTPEPGKRVLCLAITGWGNLAGIIGSELFLAKYGPDYHWPLTVMLGLIVAAWVGFAILNITCRLVNRWRAKKLAGMTAEEIEQENLSDTRYGDKKWTFVYGL